MAYIKIEEVAEKMNLVNLTPEIDVSGRRVRQSEVNRPALELTG